MSPEHRTGTAYGYHGFRGTVSFEPRDANVDLTAAIDDALKRQVRAPHWRLLSRHHLAQLIAHEIGAREV